MVDGYCLNFLVFKPDNYETGMQFAGRLLGYFYHMGKTANRWEKQRKRTMYREIRLYLKVFRRYPTLASEDGVTSTS